MLKANIRTVSKITLIPAAITACLLTAACTTTDNLPELPSVAQRVVPVVPVSELPREEPARKNQPVVTVDDGAVAYEIVDLSSIVIE